jgi:hypothetical protein
MVGRNRVGDLLQNSCLTRARRRHDQAACPFPERGYHVDDARLNEIGAGLESEFLDGVDRGQVLETERFGIILEKHPIDPIHRFELRTVATVRRLRRALHQAAFPKEGSLDGVRRYKNVCRLRVEMIFGGPEETEAFFGDFQITGAYLGRRVVMTVVSGCCAHTVVCVPKVLERIPETT